MEGMEPSPTTFVAIGGVVGAVFMKLLDFLLAYMHVKHKSTIEEQDNRSTIEDREQISRGYHQLIDQLQQQINTLKEEARDLQKAHADCRVESACLRGEVRLLHYAVSQLRMGQTGDVYRGDSIIIADGAGTILEWNSFATLLFHYTRDELIGKSIGVVIPEEFIQEHLSSVQHLRDYLSKPKVKALSTTVFTKEGEELMVDIHLSTWSTGDSWYYALSIKPRLEIFNGEVDVPTN